MKTIDIVKMVARAFPGLRKKILTAHLNKTPPQYVKQALLFGAYGGFAAAAMAFFLFARSQGARIILVLPVVFIVFTLFFFLFRIQALNVYIRKRQKEMDREVLFAGRFLLVKIESGTPIFNALTDVSRSYGVGGKYFREIVNDIETGTPIEKALDRAREYSASEKFKKLLRQLIATLKTGTDVTQALRSTLHTITQDQLNEIRAYGKKLNSLMLFYLVLAVVAPSLGVTLFLLIASFVNLDVPLPVMFSFLFFLALIQLFFLALIKQSRPAVDI